MKQLRVKETAKLIKGIQSIEIGGEILEVLANAGKPMPLGQIAALAQMSASKVRRYLVSFGRVGFVEQSSQTGLYDLGWFALRLGLRAQARLNIIEQSRPVLRQVCQALNETVALVVWTHSGPTVVGFEESDRGLLRLVAQVGATLPLLTTAAGRVFGAYMPENVIRKLLEEEIAAPHNYQGEASHLDITIETANAIFADVRKRGLARSTSTSGEIAGGVVAMACPILATKDKVLGALVVLGHETQVDLRWTGKTAVALQKAAVEVTKNMGFSSPGLGT